MLQCLVPRRYLIVIPPEATQEQVDNFVTKKKKAASTTTWDVVTFRHKTLQGDDNACSDY
jgi:hypothetical protein